MSIDGGDSMKLKYLGTAAAEGWPAVFCNCEYCLKAKKAGGRNIRTRSQAMINGDMLIDFPTDTNMHMLTNGLDLSAVKYIIVTHSHLDHFQPLDLFFHHELCYAHEMTEKHISLYGNRSVMEKYRHYIGCRDDEDQRIGVTPSEFKAFTTYTLGNYEVTPLPAYHAEGQDAFVYLIREGKKTILYLHDTGLPPESVYEYLTENGIKADLISYDCTYVILPSGGGHLGLDSCVAVRDKLCDLGIATEKTIHIINHFSHNGKLIHDELVPVAAELGFLTSYDGMEVEI